MLSPSSFNFSFISPLVLKPSLVSSHVKSPDSPSEISCPVPSSLRTRVNSVSSSPLESPTAMLTSHLYIIVQTSCKELNTALYCQPLFSSFPVYVTGLLIIEFHTSDYFVCFISINALFERHQKGNLVSDLVQAS